MTKADAIYYLTWLKDEAIDDADSHRCEALDMAIEALKGRPKGHWVPYKFESCTYGKTNYICSECGHVGTKFKEGFCMCCGADMRGDSDD